MVLSGTLGRYTWEVAKRKMSQREEQSWCLSNHMLSSLLSNHLPTVLTYYLPSSYIPTFLRTWPLSLCFNPEVLNIC